MADDLIIDLSNYKDRLGSRVDPGPYRVVVEDAESAESAAKNPMVNLWFRIVGGEFDGQTITDRLVLTEKSLFRVVGFMQAINLPTPKKRLKVNIRQFVGKTLDVDVDDGDPYNGRIRSEIRGYKKVAGANKVADDAEDIFDTFSAPPADENTSALIEDLPEPTAAPELKAAVRNDEPSAVELALAAAEDDSVDLSSISLD
jgi:hypothetical protein